MAHAMCLVVTLAVLMSATFVSWRRRGRISALWAPPWTLVLAELALTLMPLVAPAPPPGRPAESSRVVWTRGFCVNVDLAAEPTTAPNITFLGDSFTEGQGVAEGQDMASRVGAALAADGSPVQVRNWGVRGANAGDEAVLFAAMLGHAPPDVLVWQFVLNDLGSDIAPRTDLISSWPDSGSGVLLVDRLRKIVEDRRTSALNVEIYRRSLQPGNPAWAPWTRVVEQVVRAQRARGGRTVVVVWPLLFRLDDYPFGAEHARLIEAAKAAGAEVLDLAPVFAGQDERQLWVSPADHHPNGDAHRQAADALLDQLRQGPMDPAGAVDCGLLPTLPEFDAVLRALCEDGTPERWLQSARALTDHAPGTAEALYAHPKALARTLAYAAERRAAGTEGEAAVRAEVAVVEAALR